MRRLINLFILIAILSLSGLFAVSTASAQPPQPQWGITSIRKGTESFTGCSWKVEVIGRVEIDPNTRFSWIDQKGNTWQEEPRVHMGARQERSVTFTFSREENGESANVTFTATGGGNAVIGQSDLNLEIPENPACGATATATSTDTPVPSTPTATATQTNTRSSCDNMWTDPKGPFAVGQTFALVITGTNTVAYRFLNPHLKEIYSGDKNRFETSLKAVGKFKFKGQVKGTDGKWMDGEKCQIEVEVKETDTGTATPTQVRVTPTEVITTSITPTQGNQPPPTTAATPTTVDQPPPTTRKKHPEITHKEITGCGWVASRVDDTQHDLTLLFLRANKDDNFVVKPARRAAESTAYLTMTAAVNLVYAPELNTGNWGWWRAEETWYSNTADGVKTIKGVLYEAVGNWVNNDGVVETLVWQWVVEIPDLKCETQSEPSASPSASPTAKPPSPLPACKWTTARVEDLRKRMPNLDIVWDRVKDIVTANGVVVPTCGLPRTFGGGSEASAEWRKLIIFIIIVVMMAVIVLGIVRYVRRRRA